MPATAGRVRMPANNRVHSSSALQTHGIWQSTIGYDPYAPKPTLSNSNTKPDTDQNPYANYQGLLQLARLTAPSADVVRGACKRCGRVGHLTYQCRNFLSVKDNEKEDDPEATQADIASQLGKLKGKLGKAKEKDIVKTDSEDEEDEDSESSDSDYDSDMERLIDQRCGKKSVRKDKLKKKKDRGSDVDGSDTDSEERKKKRGRSKKRRSRKRKHDDLDDSEKDRKKRRKSKGRKRNESSDEDGKRRRHRRSRK